MINRRTGIRAMKRGLLAVFLVFTITSVSQAGPIGVVIEPLPVISVGLINIGYNVLTGAFSANGFAQTLLDSGGVQSPVNAPFRILATIDRDGHATNGNLTIGSVTLPLLSGGHLMGFAFQGTTLEFLFDAIGGSYASGVYSGVKPVDVMLTVGSFAGSFASSWSSSSNTALVREDDPPIPNPEPSTLLLVLAAAGGLSLRRRKRSVSI